MAKLPILSTGDFVEIIAPASRCSENELINLIALLESWQLKCIVDDHIFGNDLLCANSDEHRLKGLEHALTNVDSKAIICVRGGYGSMRLIPGLRKLRPPHQLKWFVGMSDLTALHLFFQNKWHWPTLHAALNPVKCSQESILTTKAILFGEKTNISFQGMALNDEACNTNLLLKGRLIGGNLVLVQASIATSWEMDAKGKIIIFEEVGERAYKVDRMLEHLNQANRFHGALAIIFADFIQGEEPDGSSKIMDVLKRFACSTKIPVVKISGVGHDKPNYPLILGATAELQLGQKVIFTNSYADVL
jgi:muramoyltetrapeptide carboxypeptidase